MFRAEVCSDFGGAKRSWFVTVTAGERVLLSTPYLKTKEDAAALAAQINAGAEAMERQAKGEQIAWVQPPVVREVVPIAVEESEQDAAAKERERGWQDAADCLEACEKRHGVFDSTTAIQIIREHSGLKRGDHESEAPR